MRYFPPTKGTQSFYKCRLSGGGHAEVGDDTKTSFSCLLSLTCNLKPVHAPSHPEPPSENFLGRFTSGIDWAEE